MAGQVSESKTFEYVLMDVDTQNDFMDPKGALYVEGADCLIPNLLALLEWAENRGVPVVSSVDAHVPDDPEFAQFPPHCVVGTWGQQKISGTLLEPYGQIPPEGEAIDVPAIFDSYRQLVFETRTFSVFENASAKKAVQELIADHFIVCGVATDYCVRVAVEGLLALGKAPGSVVLVTDAIEGIDKSRSEAIIKDFSTRGVALATTSQILAK